LTGWSSYTSCRERVFITGLALSVTPPHHPTFRPILLKLFSSWRTHKSTNECQPRQRWRFRATGCDLSGCTDSTGVSDILPTGPARSHSPLVQGSNPCGPTSQPIQATAVRSSSAKLHACRRGRLKLFSQLFEAEVYSSGIFRQQNRRESFCQDRNGRGFGRGNQLSGKRSQLNRSLQHHPMR